MEIGCAIHVNMIFQKRNYVELAYTIDGTTRLYNMVVSFQLKTLICDLWENGKSYELAICRDNSVYLVQQSIRFKIIISDNRI
jgi:hypothetical protein